jgi:hypothetical protein
MEDVETEDFAFCACLNAVPIPARGRRNVLGHHNRLVL